MNREEGDLWARVNMAQSLASLRPTQLSLAELSGEGKPPASFQPVHSFRDGLGLRYLLNLYHAFTIRSCSQRLTAARLEEQMREAGWL